MELTQRIRELTALPGVSGQEDAVREYLLRALQGREDCDCRVDALGNLIVKKTGRQTPAKSLLITAHMDEVGYLITYIEDSGLLRFAPVGGVSPEVRAGKRVYVGQKLLPGLVGLKAVHQQKAAERTAPPEADNLYIDIGAKSREEAESAVTLGDRVSFAQNYARFGEGFVRAKALDTRLGCAFLLELLLSESEYSFTGVFTVQEENGCIGAKAAAGSVQPDIGLILETTTASGGGSRPGDLLYGPGHHLSPAADPVAGTAGGGGGNPHPEKDPHCRRQRSPDRTDCRSRFGGHGDFGGLPVSAQPGGDRFGAGY